MAKSHKQATKKAQFETKLDMLDSIGTSKESFEVVKTNVIERILGEFVERVQNNIDRLGLPVTGAISEISIQSDGDTINVVGNPHLIYQSRGVSGTKVKRDTPHSYKDKRPPVQPIIDWIKNSKKITINESSFGGKEKFKDLTDDEKITRVAYAIREKIFQEGFEGKDIYEKEIPKLVEDLQKEISDFAVQYINQVISINPREGGGNRIVLK